MADGNEYRGKTKLGIIAALCAAFSIWLMIASKSVLTAVVMITLAVFLFVGFRAAKYIFIVLQFTRGYYAVTVLLTLMLSTEGFSFLEILYYILYLIYAVVSIIMLFADKDIREFYRK
ncbi:MAG: hypothetical protein HDT21_09985 [Ruminococcus sp.]|nr:hypothetical protein [Ruminococcus sp.]